MEGVGERKMRVGAGGRREESLERNMKGRSGVKKKNYF